MPQQPTLQQSQPDIYGKLLPFCDQDSSRYALQEPWVYRGWIYATDGRILVAMPTTGPDSPIVEGKRRPDCSNIMSIFGTTETPRDFPVLQDCFKCNSTGLVDVFYRKCERCGGTGERELQKPGGIKRRVCHECHGEGEFRSNDGDTTSQSRKEPCPDQFCGFSAWSRPFNFARHYLLMIRELLGPGLKCGVHDEHDPVFVAKANGVTCVLMARRCERDF